MWKTIRNNLLNIKLSRSYSNNDVEAEADFLQEFRINQTPDYPMTVKPIRRRDN